MRPMMTMAAVAAFVLAAGAAQAQTNPQDNGVAPVSAAPATSPAQRASGEPDVFLDVPNLSVEEITIEVDNLQAEVALQARLANLLHLSAGADVSVDQVKITIKGVEAQLQLIVRLDNVAQIIDRTLTTIDRNPEILQGLFSTVDNAVGTVGGVAGTALQPGGVVDNAVGTVGGVAGQTIETTGEVATGVTRSQD